MREAAHHCELKEIGTHTLRKTCGYLIYQETKDIALVQEILGHSTPFITKRYIGLNQEAIDDAFNVLNQLKI